MKIRKCTPIVALDVTDLDSAVSIVNILGGSISWYKIGSVLFTKEGPSAVEAIKKLGKNIFLDLKFYDIPNTVAGTVKQCVRLGVDMLTVHASGGKNMIERAVETSKEYAEKEGGNPPKIIAVTVLTSFDENDLKDDFGLNAPLEDITKKLVSVVMQAGADGIVASPNELKMLRKIFGEDLTIITPGVRPVWSQKSDQKRVMAPAQAKKDGSDFLVIGRPIIASTNPKESAEKILDEIRKAGNEQ